MLVNCALDLNRHGVLDKYNVEMISASSQAIDKAEDREQFRQAMKAIELDTVNGDLAHDIEEARAIVGNIGFPAIIRPSFTLGGSGGGIAYNMDEFDEICSRGLDASPTKELLIEESIIGWKEYEMEVVRDQQDNCIIVCSIENFDPMGVHTGDSITVAPAQTLTDKEYQIMRDASIAVLREIGVDTGGSNVQFAVNPDNGRLIIIEMNPRVSRSSALASKATGFPIAKVAAKLAVGFTLDELSNDITGGATPASFEPSIDYVVTKIPPFYSVKEAVFPFIKFPGVDTVLGPEMKSTGEVMGIGDSFGEAFGKAQNAAGYTIPQSGRILFSLRNEDQQDAVPLAQYFVAAGFELSATEGTAKVIRHAGIPVKQVNKVIEGRPHVVDDIKNDQFDLIINTTSGKQSLKDSYTIRREALLHKVTYYTTLAAAKASVAAHRHDATSDTVSVRQLQTLHKKLKNNIILN